MSSRSVLLIAKAYPPTLGGVENYSRSVALAYRKLGLDVTVITQNGPVSGWSLQDGIDVYNVGAGTQLAVARKMWWTTRQLLKKRTFSFTHCTTWRVAIPAILNRAPQIHITAHGREIAMQSGLTKQLMKGVLSHVDQIVAVSNTTCDMVKAIVPECSHKCIASWNGVDRPKLQDDATPKTPIKKDGELLLLTSCRLVARKNISSVLKAIRLLIDQGNRNIRYIVTGDGELRSDLEQQSQSLNLTPHVEFAGRVSEERLANLQAEADIFLHPQINLSGDKDFEGFGLAIAEAMACGIPVVAGNEGAPKEFVQHGVTGFLVDGSPQEIADATSQLLEDRELRQRIGQNAKRWVRDNLSWDKHIRPFLNESFSEN